MSGGIFWARPGPTGALHAPSAAGGNPAIIQVNGPVAVWATWASAAGGLKVAA
jgi:hypothetical protein